MYNYVNDMCLFELNVRERQPMWMYTLHAVYNVDVYVLCNMNMERSPQAAKHVAHIDQLINLYYYCCYQGPHGSNRGAYSLFICAD